MKKLFHRTLQKAEPYVTEKDRRLNLLENQLGKTPFLLPGCCGIFNKILSGNVPQNRHFQTKRRGFLPGLYAILPVASLVTGESRVPLRRKVASGRIRHWVTREKGMEEAVNTNYVNYIAEVANFLLSLEAKIGLVIVGTAFLRLDAKYLEQAPSHFSRRSHYQYYQPSS